MVIEDLISGFVSKLNEAGLDDDWEIERLKKESEAPGKLIVVKVKGAINPAELENTPFQLVAISGVVERRFNKIKGDMEEWFGDGESLLICPQEDWGIQQGARRDVQKLKGRFIEHHVYDLEPGPSLVKQVMDEIDGRERKLLPMQVEE